MGKARKGQCGGRESSRGAGPSRVPPQAVFKKRRSSAMSKSAVASMSNTVEQLQNSHKVFGECFEKEGDKMEKFARKNPGSYLNGHFNILAHIANNYRESRIYHSVEDEDEEGEERPTKKRKTDRKSPSTETETLKEEREDEDIIIVDDQVQRSSVAPILEEDEDLDEGSCDDAEMTIDGTLLTVDEVWETPRRRQSLDSDIEVLGVHKSQHVLSEEVICLDDTAHQRNDAGALDEYIPLSQEPSTSTSTAEPRSGKTLRRKKRNSSAVVPRNGSHSLREPWLPDHSFTGGPPDDLNRRLPPSTPSRPFPPNFGSFQFTAPSPIPIPNLSSQYSVPPPSQQFGQGASYRMPTLANALEGLGCFSSSGQSSVGVTDGEVNVGSDCLTLTGFERHWQTAEGKPSPSALRRRPPIFRICTYNVLCQETIGNTKYLYNHTRSSREVLEWQNRWPLLKEELRRLDADVLGMQEVGDSQFYEFFRPFMQSLGYSCLFKKKSEGGVNNDGCGLFVRDKRFKVEMYRIVEYCVDKNDGLLDKPNVGQIARLRCVTTDATLVVANTHILFNPMRGDIKLMQIAQLLAEIQEVRKENEPLIMMGDFNIEPNSPLSEFITSGTFDIVNTSRVHAAGFSSFNMLPHAPMLIHAESLIKAALGRDSKYYHKDKISSVLMRQSDRFFTHELKLASVYKNNDPSMFGISTYHKDIGNPDWLFYSVDCRETRKLPHTESNHLRLLRLLSLPTNNRYTDLIRKMMEPWPNRNMPSDHIPLMAEFTLHG